MVGGVKVSQSLDRWTSGTVQREFGLSATATQSVGRVGTLGPQGSPCAAGDQGPAGPAGPPGARRSWPRRPPGARWYCRLQRHRHHRHHHRHRGSGSIGGHTLRDAPPVRNEEPFLWQANKKIPRRTAGGSLFAQTLPMVLRRRVYIAILAILSFSYNMANIAIYWHYGSDTRPIRTRGGCHFSGTMTQ